MSGSQATLAPRRRRIRHPELIPPAGAKAVGVDEGTNKIIYEMSVLDVKAMAEGRVQKVDHNGEPMFRKHPTTGVAINPIMVLPKEPIFRKKRFILLSTDALKVKMVEDWLETDDEREERERREQEAAFSADLAAEAVRRGFKSAKDMMASLFGDDEQPQELQKLAVEADENPIHIDGMPVQRPEDEQAPPVGAALGLTDKE